jgi:hypothetical protein
VEIPKESVIFREVQRVRIETSGKCDLMWVFGPRQVLTVKAPWAPLLGDVSPFKFFHVPNPDPAAGAETAKVRKFSTTIQPP